MHPIPCFRVPLTPRVGVQGRNYFKNLSAIKIYTYAKFHPDWSDSLDFYKVRICSFSSVATLVPTIGIYEVKREKNKVFSFSFIQATELRREGAVTEEEKFLDFYRTFTSFLRII
jgi:hypothetical protein